MDYQEEYRKLKENVQELSNKKQALERQIKDIKSLRERRVSLTKEVAALEAELAKLSK